MVVAEKKFSLGRGNSLFLVPFLILLIHLSFTVEDRGSVLRWKTIYSHLRFVALRSGWCWLG